MLKRRLARVGLGAALAGVIVAAASWLLVVRLEWPGGMRSDYPARDGDPRLTDIARTATTLIAAIERHHSYAGVLPNALDDIGIGESTGWVYVNTEPNAYLLIRKLGWDTALVYERRADEASWIFSPGDGDRADLRITLNP